MRHDTLIDLVPIYALDALEPAEEKAIEAHLTSCGACIDQLDRFRFVAASMIDDGPAPIQVWDRIVEELEQETPAPVARGDFSRRSKNRTWMVMTSIAAGFALFFAGFIVANTDQSIVTAAEQAAGATDSISTAFEVDGVTVAQVVLTRDGQGFIVPTDELDALDTSRTYQLWVITDQEKVISAGVLGSDPQPSTFTWDGTVSGFALTREVAGGVVTSDGDVVSVTSDI